jgi:hypothetical protein
MQIIKKQIFTDKEDITNLGYINEVLGQADYECLTILTGYLNFFAFL